MFRSPAGGEHHLVQQRLAGVQHVLTVATGSNIQPADLPDYLTRRTNRAPAQKSLLGMTMQEIEIRAIEETLKATGYDKHRTAQILEIGLRTLYRKMKQYQIGG